MNIDDIENVYEEESHNPNEVKIENPTDLVISQEGNHQVYISFLFFVILFKNSLGLKIHSQNLILLKKKTIETFLK